MPLCAGAGHRRGEFSVSLTMQLANSTNEPIPGYKVQERIGAGGYGEVWTVEAPGGLAKAIKFVYGYLDEERASRELKALNRIKSVRHPFLISLERIEVVEGQLVIITELAEGSLKDRFDQCQKEGLPGIPRNELLTYVRDAADALDYMSENYSLQHLDIKPENLLLVGRHVKVADFGLVKELHEVTGSLMGGLTPLYAPPESFDGRPSKFSDQYSLAIVYQEMLSGVLPFPGTTAAQLAAQHLHSKPRVTSLPPAEQQVVLRALSKDPAERFSSCIELVEHLEHAARGRSCLPKVEIDQLSPEARARVSATSHWTTSANWSRRWTWGRQQASRLQPKRCPHLRHPGPLRLPSESPVGAFLPLRKASSLNRCLRFKLTKPSSVCVPH